MLDFTLNAYAVYLNAIKESYDTILTFEEYLSAQHKPDSFCLIRHDADRKPKNAYKMARIEHEYDICSTYYFRCKKHTFKPHIIKEIFNLGHEIGYHYESLSDTNGDMVLALKDFEKNLKKLRTVAPVKTISMHGRPFSSFDNRHLWTEKKNSIFLKDKLGILGEIYLDIDYSNIAYIGDTGRNWRHSKNNIRDMVSNGIKTDFRKSNDFLIALRNKTFDRLVIQIHPERWSDTLPEWILQLGKDNLLNIGKGIVKRTTQ